MNRWLLLEVGLALLLLVLAITLYLRPAAEGFHAAAWWHWIVLAMLLFSVLGLRTWRGREQRRRELRRSIRADPPT